LDDHVTKFLCGVNGHLMIPWFVNSRHIWLKMNQTKEGTKGGSKMSIWFNMKCWEQNGGISQIAHWDLQRFITTFNTCPYKSFEAMVLLKRYWIPQKVGNLKRRPKKNEQSCLHLVMKQKKLTLSSPFKFAFECGVWE
jgi:hypothetical protein